MNPSLRGLKVKRYTVRMQKNDPISVGIDVGTSTVRCVIGLQNEDQTKPTIVGAGSSTNTGMRKGAVINVDEVANAIHEAVEEAERISGQHVSSASISVNGSHIIGLNSKGVIAISSASREITLDDLQRAEEAATVVQLPPNREILQVFAKNYHLDGQENIKDPIGMNGVRLEVDAHIVTGAAPAIRNLDRTFDNAGIKYDRHIVAGLASAEAVLEPKQRESGSVVVDIGAGTTNIAVFEEDDAQHVAVLPVGSINLTNDLAIGLKTDLDVAEKVKLKHARAAEGGKRKKMTSLKAGDSSHTFETDLIDAIVQARLGEMFDLVDKELQKIGRSRKLPGGVVLVGGGSLLPGIDDFVKEKLELPARVTKPKNYTGIIDTTDTPAYACAVGLMMMDMQMRAVDRMYGSGSSSSGGFSAAGIIDSAKSFLGRFKA